MNSPVVSRSSSCSSTPPAPTEWDSMVGDDGGRITFWAWATEHNLADPNNAPTASSVREEILQILRTYDWNDIYLLLRASRWNQYSGSVPESLELGTVSCRNHPNHANEPTERLSNAGVRTDDVRRIYLLDEDQPLPTGSASWSLRAGSGVTNTPEIIHRYLKMGVETGPGGPCKTVQHLRELAKNACQNGTEGYTRLEICHSDEDSERHGRWIVYIADDTLLDTEWDDETKTIIDEGFIPAAQVYWVPDPKQCTGESDCACLLCYPYRD